MAFKGVLPSDLWYKYDTHDGMERLKLDLEIAQEINSLISEAHSQSSTSAKASDAAGAVKRRNERRKARESGTPIPQDEPLSNTDDFFSIVEKAGVPVRRVSGDER